MSYACELKFFESIIWIDTNIHQQAQATALTFMFGDQIQFYKSPLEAMECFESSENGKFLIVCNSRIIKQIYEVLGAISSIYPKFLIFCGSAGRAKEVKEKDHYKQVVENAYWDTSDLICAIVALDEKLVKQPNLMNNRVLIEAPPPPPIQQKMKNLSIGDTNKKVEQSKKVEKSKPKVQASQPQVKKKKEKKQNLLANRPDVEIYWIVSNKSQKPHIQNKYAGDLQAEGYYITKIDTADDLYYELVNQSQTQHILIAQTKVQLSRLTENDSNLKLTIRIDTDNAHYRQQSRAETIVKNVEQIASTITNCV